MLIKDNRHPRPDDTTAGSLALEGSIAAKDCSRATAARRRAVILGKTNLSSGPASGRAVDERLSAAAG
jgi:Asp-tRNA(Asn)/Glu-tRNA(Gln) amidotransferase A subunit family amidase